MSGSIWIPGLLVLGIGLAGGLWAAFNLRRQGTASKAAGDADLRLKIRDLENRRDELYQRLRRAAEKADRGDRRELELAAARTLRELDELRGEMPAAAPVEAAPRPQETPTAANLGTRHPLLVGFAFGAALVLLVTVLIYFALRDAKPDPVQPGAQAPVAQGTPGEPPHQTTAPVPPELAQRIADLEAYLATSPDDLMARKELALVHMAAGQLVEAFEHAGVLLQQNPDDPDGLYVHGVVRLSMGQYAVSLDLLDRLLAQYPDHPDALMYRGLALHQLGQTEQAMDSWQLGLEMAGGSHPQIEELIFMAEQGQLRAPEPATPQPAPATTAPPSQASPAPPTATDSYGMRIELGDVASPGAVLFVFLRTAEAGPPVAAKRITQPVFPLDVAMGPGDSMMGAELPASGILVARLDGDGDVSTTGPGDLQAQSTAEMGTTTRLVLAP